MEHYHEVASASRPEQTLTHTILMWIRTRNRRISLLYSNSTIKSTNQSR